MEEIKQELKQEIAELKLRMLGSIIAVTTNAEVVQHLRSYGELEYNPGFDQYLTTIAQPYTEILISMKGSESYFPEAPCGERDSQVRTMRGKNVRKVQGSQSYLTGLNNRIRHSAISLAAADIDT